MPQDLTKKPLTKTQKWLYSSLAWLAFVLVFAVINLVIYINKSAAGTAFTQYLMVGWEGFVSMLKLFIVLPALWIVSLYQLATGSDSVFRGAELGMTFFLLATPYVFIPLVHCLISWMEKRKASK